MAKSKKKTKKTPDVTPRSPPELGPLGVWRTNFDYTSEESPYHGEPVSIPEYRKRRKRRQRRKKVAMSLLEDATTKPRALVLDDDPARHKMFEEKLGEQAELTHAYTYEQAVKALNGSKFNYIFFDHDISDKPKTHMAKGK